MLEDGIRAVGESQYNADGERFVLNTVSKRTIYFRYTNRPVAYRKIEVTVGE